MFWASKQITSKSIELIKSYKQKHEYIRDYVLGNQDSSKYIKHLFIGLPFEETFSKIKNLEKEFNSKCVAIANKCEDKIFIRTLNHNSINYENNRRKEPLQICVIKVTEHHNQDVFWGGAKNSIVL